VLFALRRLDDVAEASAEQLAKSLGLGVRTLHRRLRSEGQTYRDVLDAFRKQRCMVQLAQGSLSTKQVALELGFADPAGFHRAFKRWTGCTVGEWQRRNVRGAAHLLSLQAAPGQDA
jgi:AraC-like DNA-binding protein